MRRIAVLTAVVSATLGAMAIVPGPAGAQGETAYETEFLDPAQAASEWGFPDGETSVTEDGFTASITPGQLAVALDGAENAWLNPDVSGFPSDLAVEAQIASSSGDPSALFGVACRAKLHAAGYVFLVGTDGYFTIGRFDGRGNAKALVNAKGKATTAALNATGTNVVRGECTGKKTVTLTLLVNGKTVATAVDAAPPKKLGQRAFVVTEVEPGEQTTTNFSGFATHAL
jgi:hypothetical protein